MRKKAFSLVEILIAVSIGAFLFASYLIFYGSSFKSVKGTKNYLTAVLFAQEAIDACRAYPFDWLDKDVDISKPPYSNYKNISEKNFLEFDFNNDDGDNDKFWHTKKVGNILYTRDVEITSVPAKDNGVDLKLKYVKVIVKYISSSSKKEVEYTVKTCITKFKT